MTEFKRKKGGNDMQYVTSDTHFNHNNIQGPNGFVPTRKHFTSVEEMNETIIKNWNEKVKPEDEVIHAGDLSVNMKPKELFELLKRLHGTLIIIPGNHDSLSKTIKYLKTNNYQYNNKPKFTISEVGMRIKFNKKIYYISHFPLGLGSQRPNMRNLCGHIHEETAYGSNVLNIGIDSPEIPDVPFGTPILFETAVELVEEKWNRWYEENQTMRMK